MNIFKNELSNYQIIPRELIFDSTLSDRARFVYCFMASKPNDWDFYLEPMAKEIGYSVDTLRKYIKELVESGWLEKGEQCNDGVFGAVQYTLKATKKTDTGIFRHGEIPTQHSIDNIQKQDDKKDEEIKENTKRKKEDEKPTEEEHKLFESFRKKYQGRKRGHDTEFNYFITQNKDWREVLPILDLAVTKENILREQARKMKKFFPEPKNLQTYLGKNKRGWEQYVDDFTSKKEEVYTPTLDGFNLYWLEQEKCYMTVFDFAMLNDGYTKDNRPSCAIVMRNGIKYRWDVELKDWVKK